MWFQHSSKTFVNVAHRSKLGTTNINFRKHLHVLCQVTNQIWQSSDSASRHRAAAATQLLGSGSSSRSSTPPKSSLCPELGEDLLRHRRLCCFCQSTWRKVRQEGLKNQGCGMILKPRMILQPKPGDSETKTDDSATKNDSETKKMILKPRMIPKPRTPGNQKSHGSAIKRCAFLFFSNGGSCTIGNL